jgi:E3 ubiquitin-protein ligase MARCH6
MHIFCRLSDPFTEIPANMLLFQICIPFAIEHFKLRTTIKSLLRYWFTAVGWALGLTDFLLPSPDDNGNAENGNGERGRQERLQIAQAGVHDQSVVPFAGDDLNRVTNADAGEDYDNDEQSDSE